MEEKKEKSVLDIIAEHAVNERLDAILSRDPAFQKGKSGKKWMLTAGSACQRRSGGQWKDSYPPTRQMPLITAGRHTGRDSGTVLCCSGKQGS